MDWVEGVYYGKILKCNSMMGIVWITVPPNRFTISKDDVERIDFIEKICYNISMKVMDKRN